MGAAKCAGADGALDSRGAAAHTALYAVGLSGHEPVLPAARPVFACPAESGERSFAREQRHGIATDASLSWTAGSGVASHYVYFGTSNPPGFQGNQAGTTYNPRTLSLSTTYYWRPMSRMQEAPRPVRSGALPPAKVLLRATLFSRAMGLTGRPRRRRNWDWTGPSLTRSPTTLAATALSSARVCRQNLGDIAVKDDWASAAKPVTATLLFYAIEEGKLTGVHVLIRDHGWTMSSRPTMEFYHLANMTSGYMRPEAPGAAWAYNDYAISLYVKTLFNNVYGADPNTVATTPAVWVRWASRTVPFMPHEWTPGGLDQLS